MPDRVIVESYAGYMKRKLIWWVIAIIFLITSFVNFKELWPMFLIGVVGLGLLVYFNFFYKK